MASDGQNSSQAARLARARDAVRQRFGAADRVRSSAEFTRIQRHGIRAQSPHFVMYLLPAFADAHRAGVSPPRLGITVSRRVGNAVVRNLIKRRVRERFRLALRAILPDGAGLVVIARPGAGALASARIADELDSAMTEIGKRLEAGTP